MSSQGNRASLTTADVMEMIRSRVRSGSLVPGQRLVENDLILLTGSTRSKLREALKGLAFEGIVELQEFKGATVKRLERSDVHQMYQVREVLEGLSAKLCTLSPILPLMRNALINSQQKMDAAVAKGDIPAFIETNDALHDLIVECAQNKHVARTLNTVQVTVHRLESRLFYTSDVMKDALEEHRAITAAILAGDAEGAETAMRLHIVHNYQQLNRLADHFFQ
jgi:DNA-binding GntR family transcriptional regulator